KFCAEAVGVKAAKHPTPRTAASRLGRQRRNILRPPRRGGPNPLVHSFGKSTRRPDSMRCRQRTTAIKRPEPRQGMWPALSLPFIPALLQEWARKIADD